MSQQKNAPPPAPPVRVVEDLPELSESVVPEITGDTNNEASKLSDDTIEEKPKELTHTSATNAELDVGNNNSNLGSQDLTKP